MISLRDGHISKIFSMPRFRLRLKEIGLAVLELACGRVEANFCTSIELLIYQLAKCSQRPRIASNSTAIL